MLDLVVLIIALSIHYIADYMSEHPCYECPKYCEVDHIHLQCKQTIKQNKESKNGLDNQQLDSLHQYILDVREGSKINPIPI